MRCRAAISLLLLVGCQAERAALTITFPFDGGAEAGADAEACSAFTNVSCVNYLLFTIDDGTGNFASKCIRSDKALGSLCDVADLARGQGLFELAPDSASSIRLEGLRVFPATSCEAAPGCPRRTVFSGDTGTVRIGDFAGRDLPLPVAINEPCGPPEQFFVLPPGYTCDQVCGRESLVVCQVQDGCLCRSP